MTSVQTPPHDAWPAAQGQTPLVQVTPLGHTLPQAPQLLESV